LVRDVRRTGVGIHAGSACAVVIGPAAFGVGIVFVTPAGRIEATPEHAEPGEGATRLVAGRAGVSTPEHLLAALAGLGVTDATVVLDGPELPALDGSAAGWVEAIDEAGRVEGPAVEPWAPDREIVVEAHGGRAVLAPGAPALTVHVDFGDGGPSGSFTTALTEAAFRGEVCWARTFVLARDVDRLRAAGRGRGASPENTCVWPGSALRAADEPVRHKALDAWGDLALLGPTSGRVEITRGSHALHLALVHVAARHRAST
jgi:UDP-3-O-[3-hydroxymyristoyl] N-acetylglucosamine deacetylase